VFELEHQGARARHLRVQDIVLLDDGGNQTALRRVQALDLLSTERPAPAPSAPGSWAYYLDERGQPFDGTLAGGRFRIRVRASLKSTPSRAVRFRVTLAGFNVPIVVEGPVVGAWPT
jgi:hypothetical protein